MIMIPVPYLVALIAVYFLIREIFYRGERSLNLYLVAFLSLAAAQTLLIGTRFGYGIEWLGRIQPLGASLVPPLAYLSFARPNFKIGIALCLISLSLAILILLSKIEVLDGFFALNNIIFAAAAISLALNSNTALSWVGISNLRKTIAGLWAVIASLLFSGFTDLLITWDFWANKGTNLSSIVKYASLISLIVSFTILVIWLLRKSSSESENIERDDVQESETFERIEILMREERLFIDPDLNLNRIARKLVLPVRDVSRAINGQTNQNISQYVNALRVEEAAKKMTKSNASILEILLASGFNTKSNFNREFVRVKKMTPSEWRALKNTPKSS